MSKRTGNTSSPFKYVLFGLVLVFGLVVTLVITKFFQDKNFAIFNPKGFIAGEQSDLIILATALLLAIAVPTLSILYFFAWKYRETNDNATYSPQAKHGRYFVFSIWAIPSTVMVILALIMIPATHRLDPRKPISSANDPLTIQVVAMQWKWVFIYPEHNIATVNFVQVPTDTPIVFKLSADESPMSSFWIPNLGGQLYAMTGHVNTLNLMAEEPGDYPGSSAELTGAGFAGMKFVARASSSDSFDQWVSDVKSSPSILDRAEYSSLLKPSENNKVALYSGTDSKLFSSMLLKYTKSHGEGHTSSSGESHNQAGHE